MWLVVPPGRYCVTRTPDGEDAVDYGRVCPRIWVREGVVTEPRGGRADRTSMRLRYWQEVFESRRHGSYEYDSVCGMVVIAD